MRLVKNATKFWGNLSAYILSHPSERNKIQMMREEEGGEGLAELQKRTAETDVSTVFY